MIALNGNSASYFRVIGPLPSGSPFWGRSEECHDLVEILRKRKYPVITVTSLSGEGKSALVLNAVQTFLKDQDQFRSVIWINCRNVLNDTHLFKRILTESDINERIVFSSIMTPESCRKAVIDKLQNECNLLILDNIEGLFEKNSGNRGEYHFSEMVEQFIIDLLSKEHQSQAIITSRVRLCSNGFHYFGHNQREFRLSGLDEHAIKQILSHSGVHRGVDHLSQVLEVVDGHPQLLHLIGQYIHDAYKGDATKFGEGKTGLFEKLVPLLREQLKYLRRESRELLESISVFQDSFSINDVYALVSDETPGSIKSRFEELSRWHLVNVDLLTGLYRIPPVIRLFCYNICRQKQKLHRKLEHYYLDKQDALKNDGETKTQNYLLNAAKNAFHGNDFTGLWTILFKHGLALELKYSCRDMELCEFLEAIISDQQGRTTYIGNMRFYAQIELAETYERMGNCFQALTLYFQVLDFSFKESQQHFQLQALLGAARIYMKTGYLKRTKLFLKEALKLTLRLRSTVGEAEVLYHFGVLNTTCQKFSKASALFSQARETLNGSSCGLLSGKIYFRQAQCFIYEGDMKQGFEDIKKAERIFDELNYYKGQRDILLSKAVLFAGINNFEHAAEYIQRALQFSRQKLPKRFEAKIWATKGRIHYTGKDPAGAIPSIEKSIELYREAGNLIGVSRQYYHAAKVYHEIGLDDKTISYLRSAISISKRLSFHRESVRYLDFLGAVYAGKEQFPLAFACFQQALKLVDNADSVIKQKIYSEIKKIRRWIGKNRFEILEEKLELRRNHFLSCALGIRQF
ncbi:MAG: hypothetical protein A2161_11640 [Candidatus Schekmanbacteria bacterium RBG_13_48_7]|uniref:Novel STAND NTPase 1 domain-containing protein n=1 Tax=Candidatus Schekmanbacteria bacterium RBG_13_48_7 TaxID=1817878 RepID=A0A1F7S2P8_9BACT|nr:MAG: hypothetical protein A2161_11640 [Candidatus Schekmanbacteria bacterium RBG_13_48_7]